MQLELTRKSEEVERLRQEDTSLGGKCIKCIGLCLFVLDWKGIELITHALSHILSHIL